MSVWKYVFDNEYLQRADIESLKDANRRRRHRQTQSNARAGKRLEELEEDVEELTLLCRTLLTVLRESGTVDPAEIAETMRRIDLEDGVVDGKVSDRQKPKPQARAPKSRRPRR